MSIIEGFIRPRDNYTTSARTIALLGAAALLHWAEKALGEDINPWLIGLVVAGLLNLCALFFNWLRTLMDKPFVVLRKAREQVIQAAANLSGFSDSMPPRGEATPKHRSSDTSSGLRKDSMDSMTRAHSLLRQVGIDSPLPIEQNMGQWKSAAPELVQMCDDKIYELKNLWFWQRSAPMGLSQVGEEDRPPGDAPD